MMRIRRILGTSWGWRPVFDAEGGKLIADRIQMRTNVRENFYIIHHTHYIGFGWIVCLFRGHLWCNRYGGLYECVRCNAVTARRNITPVIGQINMGY